MTREQFVARAIRAAERQIAVPPGWWGTWREIHGPTCARILYSAGGWTLSWRGRKVGRHDSRDVAIRKGRALEAGGGQP